MIKQNDILPEVISAKMWKKEGARGIYVTPEGIVLKVVPQWEGNQNANTDGYPCVTAGPYNRAVHQLVAECYLENDSPGTKTQVDHIDGDKCNNCVDNLEWVSAAENVQRAYNSGLQKGLKVMCVETGMVFPSCGAASKYYRGDSSMSEGIRQCVRGRQSHCGNLHWKEVIE